MQSEERQSGSGRRAPGWVVLIGAAALVATGWSVLPRLGNMFFAQAFDFVALDEPPGFRRIVTGEVSGSFPPLAGLDGEPGAPGRQSVAQADLCRALFGTAEPAAGVVPIAYFTDYRCPYCRVLSGHLAALEAEMPDTVSIVWHEWPVLGRLSEQAARAALAAKRQGAYAAFHDQLMGSAFVPTPAYLRNLAGRTGVDADRLLRDMESADVRDEIARSRHLAGLLAFPGTPGLVVGRTVVVGAISEARLRQLVRREIADGAIGACGTAGAGVPRAPAPA